MLKSTKVLVLMVVGIMLVGCYNKGEIKKNIQDQYDHMRTVSKSKGDFCFYLGSVKFPYTDEPILPDDIQWIIWNKNKLAKTLPLFTDIGLLKREPVAGKPGQYHYDLTELAQEYLFDNPQITPSGYTINNKSFCYGKIYITEVTDITEKKPLNGQGTGVDRRTKAYVDFNYQLLDIPQWATDAKEKLDAMYVQSEVKSAKVIYPGSVTLIKGSDGSLYDEGGSIRAMLLQPAGTLLDDK